MYATFEEFIDHQQSPPGDASPPAHHHQEDAPPPPPPAPSGGLGTATSSITSPPSDTLPPTSLHKFHPHPPHPHILAHHASIATRDASAVTTSSSSSSSSSSVAMLHALTPAPPPPPSSRLHLLRRHQSPPNAATVAAAAAASDDLALVASPRRSRRRRPRRLRRSVDNPLLDTISAIGGDDDDSDDDDDDPPPPPPPPHPPLPSSSCPRLHPETDVIGYAGSNSVDSGYKSACPTPDLPDLMLYPEHRLEKRGSLASLASSGSSGGGSNAGSKPRIPMGTRVMSRGGGVPRSPGAGGGGVTPTRRPGSDGSYYESDQLAALRQALLGSPTEAEPPPPSRSRYSPRVSPATLPLNPRDAHIPRRAASPASPERRPRSASTGSRCSPGTRSTRKALQSGSPHLASTGSLPRATSPGGRRPSLSPAGREDARPPPAWSRHSSPGMGAPVATRGRRPPSPIVGVDQNRESELALLEREIDALLYGGRGPQYYDLESGREFPCPFGGVVQDSHSSCRPALASVRRLREELQETTTSSSANESQTPNFSSAEVSSTQTAPTTSSCMTQKPSNNFASSSSTTSSMNAFTFCSNEVAKCVLAMLEDFPKSSGTDTSGGPKATDILSRGILKETRTSPKKPRYRTTPYPREALSTESDDEGNGECSSCSEYPDYHLYEEILYEASTKPPTHAPRPPSPPPLPKRPPLIQKSALGENIIKGNKGSSVKESVSNRPLSCCRCPCEFISKRQTKFFNKNYSKSKNDNLNSQSEQNNAFTSSDSSSPPVPPVRTTSQLTGGNVISSLPSTTLATNLKRIPSSELCTPTVEPQDQTPPKPPRPKPVPPVRKSHKLCELPQQKEDSSFLNLLSESLREKLPSIKDSLPGDSIASQTSKPKQRNNLYSIFKDRHHRRFLSASLELEYHHQPESLNNKDSKNETCQLHQFEGPVSILDADKSTQNKEKSNHQVSLPSNSSQISSNGIQTVTCSKACQNNPQRKLILESHLTTQPKVCDKPLTKRRPNRIETCHKTCSLDLNQNSQTDDDYGFQALPHVV